MLRHTLILDYASYQMCVCEPARVLGFHRPRAAIQVLEEAGRVACFKSRSSFSLPVGRTQGYPVGGLAR